jgi:hypothetical protein
MPEKTCSICSKKFSLSKNPSGFVIGDEFFVCEEHSEEELFKWTKTTMKNPEGGMPIGLWLIHENNKDKTMMTVKK